LILTIILISVHKATYTYSVILMFQKHLIVLIIGVYLRYLLNVILTLLLIFWYCQHTFYLRWGNQFSQFFTASNGVRQGGIMPPVLFNIYIDELSCNLNQSYIGCIMNGMIINHLVYADDTCIITPSPSALHELLDICADFAISNFIIFNEKKTKCMCFKPNSLNSLFIPILSALMMYL